MIMSLWRAAHLNRWTDTVKPKVATTPTGAQVSIRHFVALRFLLTGASALLTALWTVPFLAIVVGTTLVLGFSKLADSWLAPFIAILVCVLAGIPSAGAALVLRWTRREAADLSLAAILLGSASGITAAAVFMNGWNAPNMGRGLPATWRPMIALAYTLSSGIKGGQGERILGLVVGASFGTFLGSMWKRLRLPRRPENE
jgi:hypothetical protein